MIIKIIEFDLLTAHDVETHLNDYLDIGWELFSVTVHMDADYERFYTAVLQWQGRGKPQEPTP